MGEIGIGYSLKREKDGRMFHFSSVGDMCSDALMMPSNFAGAKLSDEYYGISDRDAASYTICGAGECSVSGSNVNCDKFTISGLTMKDWGSSGSSGSPQGSSVSSEYSQGFSGSSWTSQGFSRSYRGSGAVTSGERDYDYCSILRQVGIHAGVEASVMEKSLSEFDCPPQSCSLYTNKEDFRKCARKMVIDECVNNPDPGVVQKLSDEWDAFVERK